MFDVIVFSAITEELNKYLRGDKIRKIYQISPHEVIFNCSHSANHGNFFVSCDPSMARFHLTRVKTEPPATPPAFCMLLRKHLEGSQILNFYQIPWERILEIELARGENKYKLIIEIMGRHSNLILLNESKIILGALKNITMEFNKYREILPGKSYFPPPPQNKYAIDEIDYNTFQEAINSNLQSNNWEKALIASFKGFSPQLAKEIIFRASQDNKELTREKMLKNIWNALQEIYENFERKNFKPAIVNIEEYKQAFAVLEYSMYKDYPQELFKSTNEMLDVFYSQKYHDEQKKSLRDKLKKVTERELKKIKLKEERQLKELEKAREAETYRIYGELLLSHLHEIEGKRDKIVLPNFYEPNNEEVTIPLDPRLTANENAQKYFQKYRKLKKGEKKIGSRIKHTRREKDYLENVLFSLENADLQTLKQIDQELTQTGYIKKQTPSKDKKSSQEKAKPLTFISSTGTTILVGRSNLQNDELTFRKASRNDTWFHVQTLPGSHVIVKDSDFPPDEATLQEAATLAAYYSKGSSLSRVTVDYTQVKNVKRAPGGKPGMAIYQNFKSITVEPTGETLQRLREPSSAEE